MDDESNNSNILGLSSAADSEWVAQNVQGVSHSVDCMLKIIEEVEGPAAEEADKDNLKRLELIALIQGINQKHQLLAARCDILIDILHVDASTTSKVKNVDDEKSMLLSPYEKKGMPKFEGQTISFDSPPSSDSSKSSFEAYAKLGSGSSSILSSDFETESFGLSDEKHSSSKLDNSDEAMNEQKLSLNKDTVANGVFEVKDMEIGFLVSKTVEYEEEIAALQDALRNSEAENAQLLSDNGILSTNLTLLEARFAESEEKIQSLETELKNCEAIKAEMKDFHQTQNMEWYNITQCLNEELNEKTKKLEALNHNLDGLKLKYDMLLSEKDGLNAKLQTLNNEVSSKDMKIQQAECQFLQLQMQHTELNASLVNALKQKDDLRLKVEELEKELKEQAGMLSDSAEEKKEAIRQLCFSLEHYRSGYQELHKAFTGQRRSAVAAK